LNVLWQDIYVNNLSIFTAHIARDLSPFSLQNGLIIQLLYVQVLSLDGRSIWTVRCIPCCCSCCYISWPVHTQLMVPHCASHRTDNSVVHRAARRSLLSKYHRVSRLKYKCDSFTLIRKAPYCLRHIFTKLANAQQH